MTDVSSELIEILANIEHERWSSWMRYMFENFTIPNLMRWIKLMQMPYAKLSEHSKESDRQEVYKTLDAIKQYYKEMQE